MRAETLTLILSSAVASMAAIAAAGANITIQTVTVGDVGNAADITGYGAVNYQYSIGRYEVTNAQYAAFLNAKAATDAYGLYHTSMAGTYGGINRSGSSGSYTYSTKSGRENWAVNYVSFWDAARFSNWLQNGQGSGDTETGTYTLGGVTNPTSALVTRNPGSTWAIASENEWYKAAYYKGGSLNAGYWLYPTQSDSITTAMANYGNVVATITPVGSYAFSSYYGAFDMGGNVSEWNEAITSATHRSRRGGFFADGPHMLEADSWGGYDATSENYHFGFRVVQIPGPSSIALLAIAGLGGRGRRRA